MTEVKGLVTELVNFIETSIKALEESKTNSKENIVTATCLWTFWDQVNSMSMKLSHECSKFCLVYMNPPLPKQCEIEGLVKCMASAVKDLTSVVCLLPHLFGQELVNEVTTATKNALTSVKNLVELVLHYQQTDIGKLMKQQTGVAWNGCQEIYKCPRNNTLAVASAMKNQSAMVTDAHSEIIEALEGDGSNWNHMSVGNYGFEDSLHLHDEDSPVWSDEDKQNLKIPVNLVKAVKLLYKRFIEALNSCPSSKFGVGENKPYSDLNNSTKVLPLEKWKVLDELRNVVENLPEAVDDLVLSLYPPVNYNNVKQNSHNLVDMSLQAATKLQQGCIGSESTGEHLTFLQSAFIHNSQLIDTKLPNMPE